MVSFQLHVSELTDHSKVRDAMARISRGEILEYDTGRIEYQKGPIIIRLDPDDDDDDYCYSRFCQIVMEKNQSKEVVLDLIRWFPLRLPSENDDDDEEEDDDGYGRYSYMEDEFESTFNKLRYSPLRNDKDVALAVIEKSPKKLKSTFIPNT